MVTILLSLMTAICYGTADFCGGLATRFSNVTRVLVTSHTVSLGLLLLALVALPAPSPTGSDLALSLAGGAFSLVGLVCLYRALGGGEMAVVAAISAVLSALVPVLDGVISGEVLSLRGWAGAALGIVATALVSLGGGRMRAPRKDRLSTTVALSIGAGVGIGAMLALVSRCSTDAGLAPVTTMRVLSVLALGATVVITLRRSDRFASPRQFLLPDRPVLASMAGCLDVAGTTAFIRASSAGEVAIAAVLAAQYPAFTVGFASGVLHEKVTPVQWLGLAAALIAVALMALG